MAEDTEANADPSMEEILASIRKIISDDNPPAEATPAEEPAAPTQEDVLELTQMIQDDGSVKDVSAPVEPEPAPVAPPPAPAPEPEFAPVPVAPPPPPAPIPAPVAPVAAETLLSEPVVDSAASKLSTLANTVEIERLATASSSLTLIGNGHRTLEDMTIELMRPLLKEWLDANLPSVVERLVQKEIERIARRS